MPQFVSRIPWRLKSIAFRVLSEMPIGVHRWFSRHITGRATRDLSQQHYFQALDAHLSAFGRVSSSNDGDSVLFEFGAGADLFSNFYLSSKGIRRQLVVDLERNVYPEALNALVAEAAFITEKCEFTADFERELEKFGITYRAPFDVRDCQLADRTVSYVCSSSTLEHIPKADLLKILSQCNRIIRSDGVMSMWIDYSDHYSHTDSAITAYNFLQFSASEWASHNSRLHYQNRLRHCHYRSLFVESGFEVVSERRFHPNGWQDALNRMRLDADFVDISREDLGATCGHFVLRPAITGR